MAVDVQKLKILLEAKGIKLTKSELKGVTKATQKAKKGFNAMSSAMKAMPLLAIGLAMKKVVGTFGEQEMAEKKLEAALGFTSTALMNQAKALQEVTMFGDEMIMEAQALIGSFVKDEEAVKAATKATLDLAAAKGMDLKAAADLVSKTLGSSTNAMSRYGIEVTGAVGSTERLESLTNNIADVFGGQASAQAATFSGSIAQMKNALGDTAEVLGSFFAPAIQEGAVLLKGFAEKTSDALNFIKKIDWKATMTNMKNNIGLIGQGILDTLRVYIDMLPEIWSFIWKHLKVAATKVFDIMVALGKIIWEPLKISAQLVGSNISEFFAVMSGNVKNVFIGMINAIKEQFNTLADTWLGEKLGLTPIGLTDVVDVEGIKEGYQTAQDDLKQQFGETTLGAVLVGAKEDNIDNIKDAGDAVNEVWSDILGQMVVTHEEKSEELKNNIGQNVIDVTENNISMLDSVSNYFKGLDKKQKDAMATQAKQFVKNMQTAAKEFPELAKAAKRAAQIEAVVNTYKAATAAYAAMAGIPVVGPVLGGIAAAGAIAAGLANIREIEKAQYGMNEVVDKPTMILAGEAGAEQVSITPLESPNLEGVQGGGQGITVNVSGNVLTSDFVEGELAESVREAVRRGTDFGIG